ncbi:MAG: SpoIID/LytB domain-containing protein [Bryobacteraceae bacterium]|nr:SpoIID/LytB domain-containing protein [Bryobacteraceae bacterium]
MRCSVSNASLILVVAAPLALTAATLDQAASAAMGARQGSVVILDARSGRVLGGHRLEAAARRAAKPGSTLKPITLAALLASAKQPPVLPCQGHPAPLGPAEAIAYSCNSYFKELSLRIDPAAYSKTLLKYNINPAAAATLDERQAQAIGEGRERVTPIQLAESYRRLSQLTPAPVTDGLTAAVKYGTARLAQTPGLEVAGKTGTATSDDRAYTHAWFAGWAPARNPEVVIVVFIEKGQGGPDAAPIARRIFEAWRPPVRVRLYWKSKPGAGPTVALSREDYVAAVLAGEVGAFKSDESLKAMAVAIRTYSARFMGRHRAEGFDFCDTTHCQDLRLAAVTDRLRRLTAATANELLWYEGQLATTYYHADCGGSLEASHHVWQQQKVPYLLHQIDTWCQSLGPSSWKEEFAEPLRVLERSPTGRVRWLLAAGRRIDPRQLGLRSTLFELREVNGRTVVEGRGYGHGVGLCQRGAARMGEEGKPYRDILAFYYPGASTGVTAQGIPWQTLGAERVEVQTIDPTRRQQVPGWAERALADAERRTGYQAQLRVRVRVYPDVASFRDSTGEPGSVAAVTRGNTVHVQASAVTPALLLHEMLHVVLETRTHPDAPLWYREELAAYLAGESSPRVARLSLYHGRRQLFAWLEQGVTPPQSARANTQNPTAGASPAPGSSPLP